MSRYREINECRISKSKNLINVLDLGMQSLTGVFPSTPSDFVTTGPLSLVWCPESGLLQLKHSYDSDEMYGENYGYRSGLNRSMVNHLNNKVKGLERIVKLNPNDVVLDIGSNDSTLLRSYAGVGVKKIGIDPTGIKFKKYYPEDVTLVPQFFSENNFRKVSSKDAKIVTSIAMFYDLEDPVDFAKQIESILDKDGIWHFEQSYMPSMLRTNSYDTICHEHLEYYSLGAVMHILKKANLKVIDVAMNSINGGSFAVTACKSSNHNLTQNSAVIDWMLRQEDRMGLSTPKPFRDFEERVYRHRDDLTNLIRSLRASGKTILGYGASTKGNVLLQFCGLTTSDIPAIAEVNEDKFGKVTPGTHIPIISEIEARASKPDYFLVLPWHFRESIVQREAEYMAMGGKLIFPFPEIEII